MRKILSFYYQKRVRLFSKILLLPLGLLNFVLLGAVNNSNAQTLNNAAQQRWTGVWADVSGQQNGTLDVTITSAGAMTGVIINSTLHLEGTWNGQISDNGELRANYTYNFNGQPYTF